MYTLLTTKLVMVVNKAHIKRMVRILLRMSESVERNILAS